MVEFSCFSWCRKIEPKVCTERVSEKRSSRTLGIPMTEATTGQRVEVRNIKAWLELELDKIGQKDRPAQGYESGANETQISNKGREFHGYRDRVVVSSDRDCVWKL